MDVLITEDFQSSWIFQDEKKIKWWIDLHFLANENGEIFLSLSDLSRRWHTDKATVSRFLARLRATPLCNTLVQHQMQRITISKSDSYKGACNTSCNPPPQPQKESSLISLSPTPPISFNPKEIIIDDNNAHTHEENFSLMVGVIASEENFIRRYQQEGLWSEAAMSAHLTVAQVQQIFGDFVVEQKHNSSRHTDYSDFKRHFLNYLRVKAEILRKQNNQGNGNNDRQNQRRGVQIVANKIEDYQGSF